MGLIINVITYALLLAIICTLMMLGWYMAKDRQDHRSYKFQVSSYKSAYESISKDFGQFEVEMVNKLDNANAKYAGLKRNITLNQRFNNINMEYLVDLPMSTFKPKQTIAEEDDVFFDAEETVVADVHRIESELSNRGQEIRMMEGTNVDLEVN